MPRYSWNVDDDGVITVFSLDKPSQVLLWQAHNPESRNFTQAKLGKAYTSRPLTEVEMGVYQVKLNPPKQGYTAYYVEMHYPSGISKPFKFSTGIKVVPDVTDYEWQFTPDNSRR
jgi:PhoPQ-activated pathogenicity-related protein